MRNDLVQHAAAVYSKHSKTKHARSRTQHARKRYAREASRKGGKNGQKSQARQRAKRCSLGRARGRSYARRYPCRAPPYRANFNLPCHDRMPPFVRENLPTQRVKTAAKAGRNFPLFFPYAGIFPYTADVTQSHKRPTVQCINARLCTAGNANLQFKSGCHLQM